MNIIKFMRAVVSSDIVVATTAVVAFSATVGFVTFYLAYLTYEDRYSISLGDYIKLIF